MLEYLPDARQNQVGSASATHCNTLQLTATHCNTLQLTATHYTILQHPATHQLQVAADARQDHFFRSLQDTATYCITLHNTALHYTTLHRTATLQMRASRSTSPFTHKRATSHLGGSCHVMSKCATRSIRSVTYKVATMSMFPVNSSGNRATSSGPLTNSTRHRNMTISTIYSNMRNGKLNNSEALTNSTTHLQ